MPPSTEIRTALAQGPTAITDLLAQLSPAENAQPPVLVSVFASAVFPLQDVLASVQQAWPTATVIGASSAGEFSESQETGKAISAWAIWGDFEVQAAIASNLKEAPEDAVVELGRRLDKRFEEHPHRVGILLLDTMSGRGEETTLLAATLLGQDEPVRLVGGAAGDDLAMKHTSVGIGAEAREDAVVLAFLHGRHPFGIGVQHGHRAESRPLSVSRATGNIVHELDGRPAWDVWREEVTALTSDVDFEAMTAEELTPFFFTHAASLTSGAEIKVRSPLQRHDDGSLAFACGLPEGAVIRLTSSDVEQQLGSARAAAEQARKQLGGRTPAGALVFDCICRKLILQDRFGDAIEAISEALGGVPVAGFETYGEIALDVSDLSGFHNSTTVVLAVG
ncbi:MAG: FIST signal transduction protein [Nannocystales bacterium]